MDTTELENTVLDLLKRKHSFLEIQKKLKLKGETSLNQLTLALEDLRLKGLIYKDNNNYLLMPEGLKQGRMQITLQGNGFLCDTGGKDIRIKKQNLNGALDGDIVIINENSEVTEIISRAAAQVVVECFEGEAGYVFRSVANPDFEVYLNTNDVKNIVPGHRLLVRVTLDQEKKIYIARIIKIIGHIYEPDIEIKAIAYSHGINDEFDNEVLMEVEAINTTVSKAEINGRVDLRDKQIFTIDGDDTKDIDDAISIELLPNGNYSLGVHIADVSNYVKRGTKLFNEAFDRGTSVYLANKVIPMLPPKLSNGICSLFPGVDRLTITCQMEITEAGEVVDYHIFESVINSQKRMTYGEVNQLLNGNEVSGYENYKDVLFDMQALSKILQRLKLERGYLHFDIREAKILTAEDGKPTDIQLRDYKQAEQIIENFMIAANETVASYVYWMDLPFPYRIHELPDAERLEQVIDFVARMGVKLKLNKNNITPKSIQHLLNEASHLEEFPVLSLLILRGMQKARYDTNNDGHFGLGLDNYTHFTSPIRRFPDLMVHELLKKYLRMDVEDVDFTELESMLQQECVHASFKERQAMEAESEVEMMKMAEYMEEHIGDSFEGMITMVNGNSIWVQTNNMIKGIVNLADMDDDYYYALPDEQIIIGKNTHQKYRTGNRVLLEVVDASKVNKTINFKIKERLERRVRVK